MSAQTIPPPRSVDKKTPALCARDVTKRFGDVLANKGVTLEIYPGEVHAIVGENGAGKTTLMRVLYGEIRPDEGQIELFGKPENFKSPKDAIAKRVAMVHQHFLYIGNFTVLENIILGHEPLRWGFVIDREKAAKKLEHLSREFDIAIDLDRQCDTLDTWELQKLEILKALYRDAQILILDEPTQVLGVKGVGELFKILRSLRSVGKTIIFITHKIPEVLAIADRVTVLRRGAVVAGGSIGEFSADTLASYIVGEKIINPELFKPLTTNGSAAQDKKTALELSRIVTASTKEFPMALKDLSLRVYPGEIVGIYGVEGNGQKELFNVLTGHLPLKAGDLILGEQSITALPLRARMQRGMAFVGERQTQGFIASLSLWENVILSRTYDAALVRWWRIVLKNILFLAERVVEVFKVKIPNIKEPVASLSGGNQQKALLGREIAKTQASFYVLKEPTRGMDIKSTNFLHDKIRELLQRDAAVLVISNELAEILRLSHRVAVIARGRLAGILTPDEIQLNPQRLGALLGQ